MTDVDAHDACTHKQKRGRTKQQREQTQNKTDKGAQGRHKGAGYIAGILLFLGA